MCVWCEEAETFVDSLIFSVSFGTSRRLVWVSSRALAFSSHLFLLGLFVCRQPLLAISSYLLASSTFIIMAQEEPPTELLACALQLMSQEWTKLSQAEDEAIAATADLDVITQRIAAMLLTRLVAIVHDRDKTAPRCFPDYSTPTVCRTLLVQPELWPADITPTVVQELQMYVEKIVERYYPTGIVPYHNAEHCFHVTLSINKLLDMVLSKKFGEKTMPPSYGLRHQPLALFAMVFSALIHDVEHTGVANRVLSSEDNPLAIQYNDQSIAENRSLYVAFDEFLCPEYSSFRKCLCPQAEDYHLMRKHVVNLVLNTDIASPEKTQLGRSKWKEAFMEEISRRRSLQHTGPPPADSKSEAPNKPNTSLASLNIRGNNNNPNNSGSDDQSMDTFSMDTSQDSEEVVPEQAPASTQPLPPGGARARRGRGAAVATTSPQAPPASPKPILRSANKKRLGIRRSMDLSGEVVDTFETNQPHDDQEAALREADQPDELKMTVVMEVLMQAADVAHNLQSWDHMVEWSCRLYLELRRAYIQGRGPDVSHNWFANQVGFLEMYLEPLAKKLDTVGVFGAMIGPSFARIVKASRDRWLLDGMEVTQAVIDAGEEWYPEGEAVEPLPELAPRHGTNDATHRVAAGSNSNGAAAKSPEAEAKITKLEAELQKTKEALEEAKKTEQQDNLKENTEKADALQKALDEKEARLTLLQEELRQAKNAEEKEKLQRETERIMHQKEQEEIKKQVEKQKEKEQKKLLKKQDELVKQVEQERDEERKKYFLSQEEIKRHVKEQEELKRKLQEQEAKQKELQRQKDEEIAQQVHRQAEMQRMLQQLEEAQKRQLDEAEKRRQEDLMQKENAIQKTRELEIAVTTANAGAQWQTIIMTCLAIALLWINVRAPVLNNLCAPASPGTKIFSVEPAEYEAPWFAPDAYKKVAFSICGARSRVRIENHDGKLSWTRADEHTTPEVLSKGFHHASLEPDHLSVTDKRGKLKRAEAPWYLPF